MRASIRLWQGLEAELGAELELSLDGGLLVAETAAQMAAVARKAAIERAQGLPVELLGQRDLRRLAPYLSPRMIGAAFCPIEGKANPLAVAPAFARAAVRHGARLALGTEVLAIDRDGQGFVATTDQGPIAAGRIVDCAGAAAGRIAAMVGVTLAIEAHPIQVNVTEPTAPLIPHLVYFAGERLTLKQARSGAFLIGGGWPARLDPASGRLAVDQASVPPNLQAALHVGAGTAPGAAAAHLAGAGQRDRRLVPDPGRAAGRARLLYRHVSLARLQRRPDRRAQRRRRDPGPPARGRHRRFRRRLTAGNHAESSSVPGLHGYVVGHVLMQFPSMGRVASAFQRRVCRPGGNGARNI